MKIAKKKSKKFPLSKKEAWNLLTFADANKDGYLTDAGKKDLKRLKSKLWEWSLS